MTFDARQHRYCRIPYMADWLALGWLPLASAKPLYELERQLSPPSA